MVHMLDYSTYTDDELLARLKNGDENAYAQLYRRYWSVLYVHSRNMLRDEEEAKDIVQDIFTMLWNKRAKIQGDVAVKPYLYTAVRNHTLNRINRGKLKDRYLGSLAEYLAKGEKLTDEQVCYRDYAARIERGIECFSPRMKQIFELSRKEGLTNKAIADALAISDHTVKKTIGRALKLLRTQISVFLFLFL